MTRGVGTKHQDQYDGCSCGEWNPLYEPWEGHADTVIRIANRLRRMAAGFFG